MMIESRCGLLCSACEYRTKVPCPGCVQMDQPFWGESCPVKACCESKQLRHCSECSEFPCDILHGFAYEEEHGDDGARIRQCEKWASAALQN